MTLPDDLEARVAALAAELGTTPEEAVRRCVAFVEQMRALTLGGFTGFTGGRP